MAVCGDERYQIDDSQHVDRLPDCCIRQLGLLIGDSFDGFSDWKTLAGRLGVSNVHVRRIEAMLRDDVRVVPGEEVLKLWRQKEKSTIRVLQQVLGGMSRGDVIRHLDHMRLSEYLIANMHH